MSNEKKNRIAASSVEDLKVLSFLCQDAIVSSEEFFFDKRNNFFSARQSLRDKDDDYGRNISIIMIN